VENPSRRNTCETKVNIEMSANERGYESVNWIQLAQYNSSLVSMVMNLKMSHIFHALPRNNLCGYESSIFKAR
jgi:hypothetical protein